jgi:cellulose biosynthesis protein BcsQ
LFTLGHTGSSAPRRATGSAGPLPQPLATMNIEQAAALVGIAIPIIAGLDFLIRWYFNSHIRALREMVKSLQGQVKERDTTIAGLQKQVRPDDWISPAAQSLIDQKQKRAEGEANRADRLEVELKSIRKDLEATQAVIAQAALRCQDLEQQAKGTGTQLQEAKESIEEYERRIRSRNRVIAKTLELEGKVWLQNVLAGAPRFIPLPERKAPVVSVLNLKGGVGKTTLTAYLAWAMARRGYRVLMVDLDLQGSLSSLFLSETQLKGRHEQRFLLRDYLSHAAKAKRPRLDDFTALVERFMDTAGSARLLATSDSLGYEELNLTFQWLFRIGLANNQWSGRRDVRMLLRRGLHRMGLKKKYDLVLLDCPPLINLCCINALAASDYVVVPVTPSRKALERVPPLLGRVREIIEEVNRDLSVLGVVANRTQWKDDMTPTERDLWKELPRNCQEVFPQPIHRFDTFLPHRVTIRDAEANFPPHHDEDILSRIDKLAAEVEGRLPHFCRPGTDVKAGGAPGPAEIAP